MELRDVTKVTQLSVTKQRWKPRSASYCMVSVLDAASIFLKGAGGGFTCKWESGWNMASV